MFNEGITTPNDAFFLRKELKGDFGLRCFELRDFWATEAALGVSMLSYNLMSGGVVG